MTEKSMPLSAVIAREFTPVIEAYRTYLQSRVPSIDEVVALLSLILQSLVAAVQFWRSTPEHERRQAILEQIERFFREVVIPSGWVDGILDALPFWLRAFVRWFQPLLRSFMTELVVNVTLHVLDYLLARPQDPAHRLAMYRTRRPLAPLPELLTFERRMQELS